MNKGGAKSTGIASFIPASFLKRLFVQSEVELEKIAEVSRNLHLAVIVDTTFNDFQTLLFSKLD